MNREEQLAWIERTIVTVERDAPTLAATLRLRWLALAGVRPPQEGRSE